MYEKRWLKMCYVNLRNIHHNACSFSFNEVIFFLGKSKSNLGWTPLHLASYFGHKEAVELLLDHGADIDAVNDFGDTPLHKAAFVGREVWILSSVLKYSFSVCCNINHMYV